MKQKLMQLVEAMANLAEEDGANGPRACAWLLLPFAVAVVAVAILYYRQEVLLVPVPARPLAGSVVDSRTQVGFTWTKVPVSANYHIQIGADRGFKQMLYETRVKDIEEIKPSGIFEPGHKYYWRLQAIVDGKPRPWTRVMRFKTE